MKTDQKIGYLVVVIYAIITLWVGIVYYEPWRDQAHIWVILRDTRWVDIFTTIPANLHPFLWFLLVKPLTVLNLPYQSSIILNILCCCAAVWLLMQKAPLPIWIKALLVFSYPIIYEFVFPGRIYALGILLVFLVSAYFNDRHIKPFLFCSLIALSFHTHTLFLAITLPAFILFIYEGWEKRTIWNKANLGGIGLVILSGLYLAWYLISVGKYSDLLGMSPRTYALWDTIALGLTGAKNQIAPLACITFLFFVVLQFQNKINLLFTVFAFGFIFYSYLAVLPEFIRYYQLLPVVLICLIWMFESMRSSPVESMPKLQSKSKSSKHLSTPGFKAYFNWAGGRLSFYILLAGCLCFSVLNGLKKVSEEINNLHSDAIGAARYINTHLREYTLVGHRSYISSSLVPYFPADQSIWYADRGEYGTYLKLDSVFYINNLKLSYGDAIALAEKQFSKTPRLALILGVPIPETLEPKWTLVYQSQSLPIQTDETYNIYVRK